MLERLGRDGLALKLRPPQEVAHVGALAHEVVRDFLTPHGTLRLAVEVRELILRGLSVKKL